MNTTTGDVVLDCREVTFIDSAAIAMLLSVRRVLRVQRRGMRLVNLHVIARHATDTLALTESFTVADLEPR